ncbi:MAG TPA: DUF2335 domain-containing protein [Chitinophagaceae bacterium]|nr:DUF2335 domain-containing protein [Chitinophagaceae bacterium]
MGSSRSQAKEQSVMESPAGDIKEISEEAEEMLKDLPEAQRESIRDLLIGISFSRSAWSGPLPPPEILKAYNKATPDAAERILKIVEAQSIHRQSLERAAISGQLKESGRGQLFGFIVALSFLMASVLLVLKGHDVSGTIIGTVDIVALVSVFIYGKYSQKRGKEFKRG